MHWYFKKLVTIFFFGSNTTFYLNITITYTRLMIAAAIDCYGYTEEKNLKND